MYYYTTDERKGKWIGAAATLLYVGLWALLMLYVSFSYVPQQTTEGIMMDLVGDPGEAAAAADMIAQVESSPQSNPVPQADDQELLTQDHEEAPVRKQVEKPTPKPKKDVEPVEKPRQVNPNAMFKPTSKNQATTSAATSSSQEAGSGKGGYDGDSKGTGGGGVDAVHSVGNRSLVGSLPLPSTDYGRNKKGKVVIEIYVDAKGYVTRARNIAGSTTNDHELIRVAIEAARKARFTTGDNDVPQVGTITYTFKLQ